MQCLCKTPKLGPWSVMPLRPRAHCPARGAMRTTAERLRRITGSPQSTFGSVFCHPPCWGSPGSCHTDAHLGGKDNTSQCWWSQSFRLRYFPSLHLLMYTRRWRCWIRTKSQSHGEFFNSTNLYKEVSEVKTTNLTFDLQDQVRFEVAAHQAVRGDVPQLVVFASLWGNAEPAARHHHAAGVLQPAVLHQLETWMRIKINSSLLLKIQFNQSLYCMSDTCGGMSMKSLSG